MIFRLLFLIWASTLLASSCGMANQDGDTSDPSNEPENVLPAASTPVPTPDPSPTPVRPEPVPSIVMATPTPFVDANEVFLRERYNGRPFQSAEEWSEKFEEWKTRRPEHPGILSGIRGLSAALRVSRTVEVDPRAVNDKWAHCVTGAILAGEADMETVEYVAWLKEYQDLVDGLVGTSFDERDFEATIDGARLATDRICVDCASVCEERWRG